MKKPSKAAPKPMVKEKQNKIFEGFKKSTKKEPIKSGPKTHKDRKGVAKSSKAKG